MTIYNSSLKRINFKSIQSNYSGVYGPNASSRFRIFLNLETGMKLSQKMFYLKTIIIQHHKSAFRPGFKSSKSVFF